MKLKKRTPIEKEQKNPFKAIKYIDLEISHQIIRLLIYQYNLSQQSSFLFIWAMKLFFDCFVVFLSVYIIELRLKIAEISELIDLN